MPVQVKVSGTWRKTLASVRVAGAWRSVPQVYVKAGGAWRALYSYSWAVGGWGACSASCGGGVQYRTVTCARNDGVTVADEVCSKLDGAKPATSQACSTQSCISCKYDAGVLAARCTGRYPVYSGTASLVQRNYAPLYYINGTVQLDSTIYTKGTTQKDTCRCQSNANNDSPHFNTYDVYEICCPF